MSETREDLEKRYDAAVKGTELWQAEVEELGKKLGREVPTGLTEKHKREDAGSSLFARSTPAEKTQLLMEDPEAYQEMLDAHEAAGLRKLFGGRR